MLHIVFGYFLVSPRFQNWDQLLEHCVLERRLLRVDQLEVIEPLLVGSFGKVIEDELVLEDFKLVLRHGKVF